MYISSVYLFCVYDCPFCICDCPVCVCDCPVCVCDCPVCVCDCPVCVCDYPVCGCDCSVCVSSVSSKRAAAFGQWRATPDLPTLILLYIVKLINLISLF